MYVLVLSCNLECVTNEVNALERYQLYFNEFEWDDDKTFLETISGPRKVSGGTYSGASTTAGQNGKVLSHFSFSSEIHESFAPEIIGSTRECV